MWDGMTGDMEVIWVKREAKYFFRSDWRGGIALIRFKKFAVWRKSEKWAGPRARALIPLPRASPARDGRAAVVARKKPPEGGFLKSILMIARRQPSMLAPAVLPYEIKVGLGLAFTRMGVAGRQRLGIDPADHVIESLVGEGCLVGLAGKDGLALAGLALGVHVLLHSAGGLLALR
jgi:hypothetical protein